jgi:PAS domain S-box-containing protein
MDPTRRILIVDHEPKSALDMERALTSAGYEVTQTESGKEGLRLARETVPHMILVDVALTDISGIDLVKLARHEDSLDRTYIVLLVREGVPPAIQARGLESGADAVVMRTYLTRDFVSRIDALLRRQKSQDELYHAVREFRATFDAISDAVYLVDLDHRVVECNTALIRLLGRPRGEIVGARCHELMHQSPKPILACLGERVLVTHRRETWEVPMDDGWQQVDVDPLIDDNGKVIGSVHVLRDITARRRVEDALRHSQSEMQAHLDTEEALRRKQTELEQQLTMGRTALAQAHQHTEDVLASAQEQVRLAQMEVTEQRRQKMAGLRRFAAGVAVEFERRLAEVLGGIEITLGRLQPAQGFYNELLAVKLGLEGALGLVRQLRAFASRELLEPQVLYVNQALRAMEPRLQRLLGRRIGPDLDLANGLRPILADPFGFEEIVLNLATHVRESSPVAGTLRLTTAPATLSEADCAAHPDARPGDYILLTVAQVSEEPALPALAYLFEPLPGTSGSGGNLALTAVEGMVHQLGGFVLVAQSAATGTRWEVYLPAQAGEPPEEAGPAEQSAAPVEPRSGTTPGPDWPAEVAAAATEEKAAKEPGPSTARGQAAADEPPAGESAAPLQAPVEAAGQAAAQAAAGVVAAQADAAGAEAPPPAVEAGPDTAEEGAPPPVEEAVSAAAGESTVQDETPSPETAGSLVDEAAPGAAPVEKATPEAENGGHPELPAFLYEQEEAPAEREEEPPGGIGARLRARLRRKAAEPNTEANGGKPGTQS